MVIIGARPQFIKSSILINLLKENPETDLQLIHTGQHYDFEMSQLFFRELEIPEPDRNLNVGSGSHAEQTALILRALEKSMVELAPDIVLVSGDTNSTLAGALTAVKLHIPVGHVEAGCRSYDHAMPEEVNRRLTDHCSLLLFAPTEIAVENLLKEGIDKETIFQVGDTMVDVLHHYMPFAKKRSKILHKLKLKRGSYALLTLHRPENVDDEARLNSILKALKSLRDLTIIFPIHPRTEKMAKKFGLYTCMREAQNIDLINPVGYLDFIILMESSKIVLTDSGGIQKEAYLLGVPCVTFRYNTEWIETLKMRSNFLVGADKKLITETIKKLLKNEKIRHNINSSVNPYGDGAASQKIVDIIRRQYSAEKLVIKSPNIIKSYKL